MSRHLELTRFLRRLAVVSTASVLALTSATAAADIKRTPSGKPDFTGVYDTGILTPTQRPEWLGETEYLYPWFAKVLNST